MIVIVRLTRGPAPATFRLRLTALLQRVTVRPIVVGGLQLLRREPFSSDWLRHFDFPFDKAVLIIYNVMVSCSL